VTDIFEERPWQVIDGSVHEVIGDSAKVRVGRDPVKRAKCLDLRCEGQLSVALGQHKRLDSEAVPRKEESLLVAVPDGERPYPVEASETVSTPRGIRGEDHLGIRLADEPMTKAAKLIGELEKVVDLAVVDEREAAVG
jgi:hypothetical protein